VPVPQMAAVFREREVDPRGEADRHERHDAGDRVAVAGDELAPARWRSSISKNRAVRLPDRRQSPRRLTAPSPAICGGSELTNSSALRSSIV
jgi:hypothetical protein